MPSFHKIAPMEYIDHLPGRGAQRGSLGAIRAIPAGIAWMAALGSFVGANALTGRIIDEANNPVKGVTVRLVNAGWQTYSFDDGMFLLSVNSARSSAISSAPGTVRQSGDGVTVTVSGPDEAISIERFSLDGRSAGIIADSRFGAGSHYFDCRSPRTAPGVYLLRVTSGRKVSVLRLVDPTLTKSIQASAKIAQVAGFGTGSVKLQEVYDTLVLRKAGYITKRNVVEIHQNLNDLCLHDTAFHLTPATFPKIDGSTTTIPLSRIFSCTLMDIPWMWRAPVVVPGSLWEIAPMTDDTVLYKKIVAIANHSKTHQAFDSLILGTRDILLEARIPSKDELDSAAAHKVTLEWRACALDALVMVVNKKQPVSGVTTQNIRDIYTGKITDWQALGGATQAIMPYQREANSGSQEMMQSLIMKETPIPGSIPLLVGMINVFETLDYNNSAISFTPNYYKEWQVRDTAIKSLAVDGIMPSRASILSRTYPHTAEVYVVTRSDLDDRSAAAKLRDWIVSDTGQYVIEQSGYIPIRSPY
jgi:phosphate transport system substrate-binding protein